MKSAWIIGLAVAGVIALQACGPKSSGEGGPVDYKESAKENYEKGMKALEKDEYVAAAKYFVYVKSRYPFSLYSVLAELRLSDADLESGHYVEAADGFKLFIKNHPTHEMVTNGYCQYRIGEAYYNQLPEDWALAPPAYEKDQSATVDAVRELGIFLDRYPGSPFAVKGREKRTKAVKMLASHEMAVARFYSKRDRPRGAILRLETLLRKFPGNSLEVDALLLLAKSYQQLERPDHAKRAYEILIAKYPTSPHTPGAKSKLPALERQIQAMRPAAPPR